MHLLRCSLVLFNVLLLMIHETLQQEANATCPTSCHCNSRAPLMVTCLEKNLTEVPSNIPTATEELFIKGNKITTLREGGFGLLATLRMLVFTKNHLEVIESNAFTGLVSLTTLDLTWNNIKVLYGYGFSGLTSWRDSVWITTTSKRFQDYAFYELNLTRLGMENNPMLSKISQDAFVETHVNSFLPL